MPDLVQCGKDMVGIYLFDAAVIAWLIYLCFLFSCSMLCDGDCT